MGFFDKVLRAIGFDDEEQEDIQEEEVKERKKKEKLPELNAKFDLRDKGKDSKQEIDNCMPVTQNEVEEIIKNFADGETMAVNLSRFGDDDKTRALDFISGGVFALNGKVEKIENSTYLLKHIR